jgi:hypothetical protein
MGKTFLTISKPIKDLKGQLHEIWEFLNGYTLEEHRMEIHRGYF